jgi:pimeloyl-[acyl-carrier protein] methyl ester esterase
MQISYRIDGSGSKTLFFIHGWAADKEIWQRQIDAFKKDCQIISVDLRGHGQSQWLDTDNLLQSSTEDILELCHKLKLKKINFLAWSMAGYILFELCKKSPELIDSSIFINCTPKFLNSQDYHCGIEEPNLKLLGRKLNTDFGAALEEFRLYMFTQKEKSAAHFAQAWEMLKKIPSPNPKALTMGLELLQNADFRQDLKSLNRPTLLIGGDGDVVIPKSAAQFMHERVKDSELAILKDCGHAPFLTYPQEFNQILNRWINRR